MGRKLAKRGHRSGERTSTALTQAQGPRVFVLDVPHTLACLPLARLLHSAGLASSRARTHAG